MTHSRYSLWESTSFSQSRYGGRSAVGNCFVIKNGFKPTAFCFVPVFFERGFSDDSLRSDGLSDCGTDGLDERHDDSFQSSEYEFDAVCIQ